MAMEDRVLRAGLREVSGRDDVTLMGLINGGQLPQPELLSYIHWLKWRKSTKTRPVLRQGDPASTKGGDEAALWKHVMGRLYGEDWKEELRELEEQRAVQEDDPDAEESEADARGSAVGSRALSPLSSRATGTVQGRPEADARASGAASSRAAETVPGRPEEDA